MGVGRGNWMANAQGKFWGARNVSHLNRGGSYTIMYNCQDSNWSLKKGNVIICKLCHSKPVGGWIKKEKEITPKKALKRESD